jgi:hypothetical protein
MANLNVEIPDDLMKAVKVKVIEDGVTLKEAVRRVLVRYIDGGVVLKKKEEISAEPPA